MDTSERLHRLGERPVGHTLAVGEAAARTDRDRRVESRQELEHQPRLAHARGAEHGDEVARALRGRQVERVPERHLLACATDECRCSSTDAAGAVLVQRDDTICDDRLRLAFQLERLDAICDERPSSEPVGGRPDQDLAHRRGLLEPCGGVHRVAGRDCAGCWRHADDDLACGDPDPHIEPQSEP